MKRRWLVIGLIILGLLLLAAGAAYVIVGRLVPSDAPIAGDESSAFPTLTGTNLLLESVTVPQDLAGELKLLVVAYDSDQQIYVDKWLRPLEELNARYPQLAGYYIPLLPQDAADAALPIMGGMTLAASSDQDRARTVVVFTDVAAFNDIVKAQGVDEIQLFLLDAAHQIVWRGAGAYHVETMSSLEAALEEIGSEN